MVFLDWCFFPAQTVLKSPRPTSKPQIKNVKWIALFSEDSLLKVNHFLVSSVCN